MNLNKSHTKLYNKSKSFQKYKRHGISLGIGKNVGIIVSSFNKVKRVIKQAKRINF